MGKRAPVSLKTRLVLLNSVGSAVQAVGPTASCHRSVKPVSTGCGAMPEMDLPFPVQA